MHVQENLFPSEQRFSAEMEKNVSSLVPGGWLIQASSTIAGHYQAALTNIAASTQKKRELKILTSPMLNLFAIYLLPPEAAEVFSH